MSEQKLQAERERFEHAERASDLRRDEEGDYLNPCVQAAWEGWQARAALASDAEPEAEPVYQTKLPGDGQNVWRDSPADIFNITPYDKRRRVYTEAAMVLAEEQLRQQRELNERLCKALNAENGPTFMGEPALPNLAATPFDIKKAVDRFLSWPLPQDFCPDCGISFNAHTDARGYAASWPIGTNLLTAEQAKAMFEYCLDDVAPPSTALASDAEPEHWLVEAWNDDYAKRSFGYFTSKEKADEAVKNTVATNVLITPLYRTPPSTAQAVEAAIRKAQWLDGPELWEILFSVFDQFVPEELTDEKLTQIAEWINRVTASELQALIPTEAAQVERDADEQYYLQDSRGYVGNSPLWWGLGGSGYTCRLDRAQRYTLDEAMRQHRVRKTDVPWPCSVIDALQHPVVDIQDMGSVKSQIAAIASANRDG